MDNNNRLYFDRKVILDAFIWMIKQTIFSFKSIVSILSFAGIIICFALNIQSGILYDICISVFSSMILIWGIDEVNAKKEKKEEEKKHTILYNRLIPLLKEYYESYLNLYIFTCRDNVKKGDKVLISLYSCKDTFLRHIRESNPFYKPGYYSDINKLKDIFNKIKNNNGEKIDPNEDSLMVYKCICKDAKKFYEGAKQLEKDFSHFFPYDLLTEFEVLLKNVEIINNLTDFIEMKQIKDLGILDQFSDTKIPEYVELPADFFISDMKLIETLGLLEKVMEYIEIRKLISLRFHDLQHFNNRNTKPIIGDAYVTN